jgi:succinoglycan biosynthesis protein ExoA
MTPKDPLISVVLPIRNEATTLPSLLAALAEQGFPAEDFEVIVADGFSTDSTREVVRHFAESSPMTVKLVDNPDIRSAPGRNVGVRAARGRYIVFIDGHCFLPSRYLLSDTVVIFEQTQAECLCRPQPLQAPVGSVFGKAVAMVRASTLGHGRDSLIYDMTVSAFVDPASSGASYRRDVFAQIGEYDERFDACEDVEFNTRVRMAGMKAFTDPRLAVFYEPRTGVRSFWKQMVRYGRGRVRLMLKHPDCFSAAQAAPAILLAWIMFSMLSWIECFPADVWLRLLFSVPVILYFAAILVSTLALAAKHGWRMFYLAPVIYCEIYLGLGFGFWMELPYSTRQLLLRRTSSATAESRGV